MNGSATNSIQTRVFAFLGSLPAILGRPQNEIMKIQSGILEQCNWMRLPQKAKLLIQWLRSRRSNSSLMAHQFSLILLFLQPQTLDLDDPSCRLDRYTVWASYGQFWSRSIYRKSRNLPYTVISENVVCYVGYFWTKWIGSFVYQGYGLLFSNL